LAALKLLKSAEAFRGVPNSRLKKELSFFGAGTRDKSRISPKKILDYPKTLGEIPDFSKNWGKSR
jgi:hypothetical protein